MAGKAAGGSGAIVEQNRITKCDALLNLWKLKCLFGLILGIICGVIPVKGFGAVMIFVPCQYLLAQYYCNTRKIPDYYLSTQDKFVEHIIPAGGTFFISWIVCYSFANF